MLVFSAVRGRINEDSFFFRLGTEVLTRQWAWVLCSGRKGKVAGRMALETLLAKPPGRLIVVCMPPYNEEYAIASVIIKTQKYFSKVVVCDDGSEDQTGELAALLVTDMIRDRQKKGKDYALKRMFQHALDMGANIVVTLDSDGQRNPNEFPRLLEPILKDKADFMLGSRYMHGGTMDAPLYQRIGLWIIYSVCKGGSRYKIRDTQNGFRAFSRKALEAMVACQSDDYGIETEQLSIATHFGLMIKEVSVSVKYCDLANISSENPVSHGTELIETAVKLVVKRRLLLMLGLPGAAFFCIGLVGGTLLL